MSYVHFSSWGEVQTAARNGTPLYYQAPMDRHPRAVIAIKVYKNGGIRIDPMSRDADNFTATASHLDRFRKRG